MPEAISIWYRTGDLVRLSDNRIIFEGRVDKDFINVGGNRVSLKKIEQITESHQSIVWAKAKAFPSKLMGSLVVIDAVIGNDADSNLVENELNRLYLKELAEFEIPSKIEFLGSVPMNGNLKK
jgi:feruloyl-CoA synthase